jgi:peptidase E
MKRLYLALIMTVVVIGLHAQPARTIFITGGNFGSTFVNYVASLTKKSNPKICFIPTASADDPISIIRWYQVCAELPVKPYVLRTFLNSSPDQKTFEETIMSMDAIVWVVVARSI